VKVYRLVARGTIEELKYLRQIYKTQLKDQTMTSTEEQSSNLQKKKFCGVAGDKDNKGELFGLANLLKFRDGTFMNYQSSASSSSKADSAMDQVVFDDFLASVRGITEDDFDELGDDRTAAMDALVKRRAGAPKHDSDDDESFNYEDFGAESQVNLGIMDRAKVAFDVPNPDDDPASRCSTVQHSSPRAGDEPCPAPDFVGSSNRESSKRSVASNSEEPSNGEAPPHQDYACRFTLPSALNKAKKRKVV
jgi:hypothetical protein